VHGYRFCGKAEGNSFLTATRPGIEIEPNGAENLRCPLDKVSCDPESYTEDKLVREILLDLNAKENYMICASVEEFCPVTGINLKYNEENKESGEFEMTLSREASNLPLTKFAISSG
jgi:hypothetical protein